ncbi:hypothetical protein JGH11_09590 [Dysgonomonas sp. Marseille-P4677]|uniref:hypothetical protein n=1 Tax=Dysgonomonas sp. Marseille-P4677 TaxID=2364790 RepID=UPI001914A937|nr:hypothetical protein [Dysgonomonas sp. Marseille-P4677]MBK5721119.1 hypothetical protein [Dysgonomonas sp. Marseille-P4677]
MRNDRGRLFLIVLKRLRNDVRDRKQNVKLKRNITTESHASIPFMKEFGRKAVKKSSTTDNMQVENSTTIII